ncbi:MAG: hypothetical protein H7Z37_13265 [Pyrinomonadaceae bacterium]|nr:hypothetical protein [Pyrinomonadaceae bacterium]
MIDVLEVEKIGLKRETTQKIDSWVVELSDDFARTNNLEKGTQVLLTFNNKSVHAEILPPLSKKLSDAADKIRKKRKEVFEELKRIGN